MAVLQDDETMLHFWRRLRPLHMFLYPLPRKNAETQNPLTHSAHPPDAAAHHTLTPPCSYLLDTASPAPAVLEKDGECPSSTDRASLASDGSRLGGEDPAALVMNPMFAAPPSEPIVGAVPAGELFPGPGRPEPVPGTATSFTKDADSERAAHRPPSRYLGRRMRVLRPALWCFLVRARDAGSRRGLLRLGARRERRLRTTISGV